MPTPLRPGQVRTQDFGYAHAGSIRVFPSSFGARGMADISVRCFLAGRAVS